MDQKAVKSDEAGTRSNSKNQLPPQNETNEIHESSHKSGDDVADSVDKRTSSVDEVAVKNSGTECVESERLSPPPQSSVGSDNEAAQAHSADSAPTSEAQPLADVGCAAVRVSPEPPGVSEATEATDKATESTPAEKSSPKASEAVPKLVETAPEDSEVVPEVSKPSKSPKDLPDSSPSKKVPVEEVNQTAAPPAEAPTDGEPKKSSEKCSNSPKPTETDAKPEESTAPQTTTEAKSPETSTDKPVDKEVELDTEEIITIEEIPTNPLEIPVVDIEDETSSPAGPKPSTSEKRKPEDSSKDDKEDDKGETEKTEFVPISQDKQDEDQQEGQPIEAEDPFGGAVETMDTDDISERNRSFSELGDETDNLQLVVNAQKSSPTKSMSKDTEKEPQSSKKSAEDEIVEITEVPSGSFAKPGEKAPKAKKADKEKAVEVISVESEEQSTVLPGQDDELCIIPDDMKIVLPPRKKPDDKPADKETSKTPEKSDKTSEVTEPVANNVEAAVEPEVQPLPEKTPGKPTEVPAETKEPETTPAEITDSVIDIEDEPQKIEVEEIALAEKCKQCGEERTCKIKVKIGSEKFNVCSKSCRTAFMDAHGKATDIPSDGANSKYEKRCASCLLIVEPNDERNLSWETMEFCNEECLGKFQTKYGSYCRNCNGTVQPISLGKYCVRFGYDVRQFCCSTCLEEFKKGLKVCSYCQKDISSGSDGFLAPVGDKGQFKDFCTQACMEKYSRMNSAEPPPPERKACSVCQEEKIVFCEVQIDRGQPQAICSEPCFAAFKFVNKVDPDQCATCKKYFQVANKKSTVVFYNNEAHTFCNKSCLNIFIITNRKIVPCNWCKVKKYNFDLIRKELKSGQVVMMCSLNCLTLYQVSINAVSARRIRCDLCKEFSQAQYHLTMSDATIRNFCSYNCVMKFQAQYTKSPITIPSGEDAPVPTGMPKRTYPGKVQLQGVIKKPEIPNITNIQALTSLQNLQSKKSLPVISSVASLAPLPSNGQAPSVQKATTNVVNLNNATITNAAPAQTAPQVIYKQQVITRPPSPVEVSNKMTMCKPLMHTKGVSVRPHPCAKSTQTDEVQKVIIPIPVPIYVPFPVHMFSFPFPVPMPFPLPIPVPIFIPTTRNSTKGIFKDLKRIQEKMPSDPFEAELLMMAEMVATDKKKTESDSDSSENENEEEKTEPVDSANTFGDEMLQMALKMATGELEEPAVDLEAALTPNTITASQTQGHTEGSSDDAQPERTVTRGRKRTVSYKAKGVPNKKGRRSSSSGEVPLMPPPESQTPPSQPRAIEPIEKPDANMALKFTFGVNAWRQWVIAKNAELEKQATPAKKVKLFKTDLLQLTADELNYSLCLFVKEVRKPNGAEYAPDTIYYLCLGIQQYLFENNRIDNIFTDTYYEKFTDCLNEVATKFSVLYNDAQYIVTRVEEEHLWECKQLGAHSPHVLLSTLMFFNTKHFNLVTVEEHMQLSFSHIMKHWKRNPAAQGAAVGAKAPGSRNVLLRFYPPQSALEANSRKKKVYEQQENEENPLRCPVKLYEFYLSKCPESVKTRNDVFYLLPERSCVPDSPVWYSTSPLAKEHLVKMLNRVKMVKEINVALLSS